MKAMGSYQWRFSESPLVDGDRVVVTPMARELERLESSA